MNWNGVFPTACIFLVLLVSTLSNAQTSTVARINRPVNDSDVALLPGGVHPRIAQALDQGRVSPNMPLHRMAMFFKPSAAQQKDLDQLLREQQDPASPNYRKWLTPEQYAARFGMNPTDLAKVSAWLAAHGFQNISVSRSRTSIQFDGTAGQVMVALHAPIHRFALHGKTHYANTAAPLLPSAFAGMVAGITSLNDFRPRAMSIAHWTSSISGSHFLVPGDVGTIYNINSLYNSGIDGTGETVAVVGQTPLTSTDDGTHADIDRFRSLGGLPAIALQQIKTGSPTYSSSDVDEANLDIEWSGAIAPKAQIIYVYSDNALFTSLPYVVDNNLAPVISVSYGNCESAFGTTDINVLTTVLQQANAQGQTVTAASGDSGAADCDGSASQPVTQATHGLAVDLPAATPYVTGMGGSEFTGDPGACPPDNTCTNGAPDTQYWKGSSSPTDTSATAKSYIPEMVWNDTDASGISAGGGGVSTLFTKPAWQTGAGVPSDGQRDVPDVSLSSSPNHDGYLICSQGSCVSGYRRSDQTLNVIGGTSAASPVFAGVVALMNQKLGMPLGNVNSTLYSLAGSAPSAFHDITTGDNKVPCQQGTKDCPNGGTIGYSAGTGYDLASGLGSVDVGALAAAWTGGGNTPDFTLSASPSSLTLLHGTFGTSTIAVTATGGPLGGSVNLSCTVSSSLGATTCSLSPNSVNPGTNSTLTVTATNSAAMRAVPLPGHPWGVEFSFGLAAMCFLPWGGGGHARRRMLRKLSLSLLGLLFVMGLVACGGGSNNNNNNNFTPLNGTVTVQATSGSLNHSLTIPVTIN
jgi:subtilase family serine protease